MIGEYGFSPSTGIPLESSSDVFKEFSPTHAVELEGILPIAKSTKLTFDGSDGFDQWSLPGHGVAGFDCGSLRFRGCLKTELHHGSLEDPSREGKAFVHAYRRSCGRKECPVCYESWAGLEAGRAVYRLLNWCVSRKTIREIYEIEDDEVRSLYIERAFKGAERKPIHVIFSVSEDLQYPELRLLRSVLYKLAKKCGLFGGCAIFHPFRENHQSKSWYWSPHFHVVGFGWIKNVESLYAKYGWIIKNAGVRKSVHATLMYQLSHAGVNSEYHTVSWFGRLAYNKLKVEILPEVKPCCPLCKHELEELIFIGGTDRPPPTEEGKTFLDAENWKVFVRNNVF